jgi:hypothetical protein
MMQSIEIESNVPKGLMYALIQQQSRLSFTNNCRTIVKLSSEKKPCSILKCISSVEGENNTRNLSAQLPRSNRKLKRDVDQI